MDYKEYLKSDIWKCTESPTGAHHWHHVNGHVWFCIYCLDVKEFPVSYVEATGSTRGFDMPLASPEKVPSNIQGRHKRRF